MKDFDVIHASPPCQAYSQSRYIQSNNHPDLVPVVRELLKQSRKPYVIENVPGAPLINPLMLCGSMFDGVRVYRHRLFETYPPIWFPPAVCNHMYPLPHYRSFHVLNNHNYITVAGHNFEAESGRKAMGIGWMTRDELADAIPPAYTEYIGKELIRLLEN